MSATAYGHVSLQAASRDTHFARYFGIVEANVFFGAIPQMNSLFKGILSVYEVFTEVVVFISFRKL